jgi:pyruvate dehydrogenase E1 component
MAHDLGEMNPSLDINFKMANYPHTQWMLGQLTAKLNRVANTPLDGKLLKEKQKPLTDAERAFKLAGEMIVTMAPDVGTSTNMNPTMDGKVYGAGDLADVESEMGVKDKTVPDLVPGEEVSDRFLRFDICEGNVMSCMGSFGKIRETLGIPLIPLMTVYDFFIKRALDQLFYNLYWKSSFILVGTPSGVTLSPEGAQHGWKSDIQIPNQITWEPCFAQELDWILVESLRRFLQADDHERSGVILRGVTRGVDQKMFMQCLRSQKRFKLDAGVPLSPAGLTPLAGSQDESTVDCVSEAQILETVRGEVLSGAYPLIDRRGYAGFEPGDNVVHVFAMGALVPEAVKAADLLLQKGIYANVFVVTSPDLLVGNLAHGEQYRHLRAGLGLSADLYLKDFDPSEGADLRMMGGRRIPVVSVHDGEIGLLDNIGSIVGVRHETLATRKHSKCGRPSDVYKYHHMDAESIVEACLTVLNETALEETIVPRSLTGRHLSVAGGESVLD